MAHTLVKMITDDDGLKYPNNHWHWIRCTDAQRTLCTGECFGEGESRAKFKVKTVEKGGITCPDCLSFIKKMKSINL